VDGGKFGHSSRESGNVDNPMHQRLIQSVGHHQETRGGTGLLGGRSDVRPPFAGFKLIFSAAGVGSPALVHVSPLLAGASAAFVLAPAHLLSRQDEEELIVDVVVTCATVDNSRSLDAEELVVTNSELAFNLTKIITKKSCILELQNRFSIKICAILDVEI
jgi:hypothetical protein